MIWLVGQYRFPLEQYSWELPEGGAPLDEDIVDCARRELMEETGFRAERFVPLLTMHLSNSVSDEIAHVFLASDLTPGAMAPDETEVLEVRELALDAAYAEVESGAITDSITVAAILRLKLLEREGRLAELVSPT
jgi:ADP-ribose pyrophosphatase